MPSGAPHPCTGRCGALVPRGTSRCPACTTKRNVSRGGAHARGYDSRWEALRKLWLAKHPLCAVCEREGRITPANTVDHVKPWQSGATEQIQQFMRYDFNNLQSMCAPCHSRKTALQDGGFGHARVPDAPRVTGVAMRAQDGTVYTLPAPNRHHDLIRHLVEVLQVTSSIDSGWESGFVDSLGRWLRRRAALGVATQAQQLLPRATCNGGQLFSEDVW